MCNPGRAPRPACGVRMLFEQRMYRPIVYLVVLSGSERRSGRASLIMCSISNVQDRGKNCVTTCSGFFVPRKAWQRVLLFGEAAKVLGGQSIERDGPPVLRPARDGCEFQGIASKRSEKIQHGLFSFWGQVVEPSYYLVRFRSWGTVLLNCTQQVPRSSIVEKEQPLPNAP